MSAHKGPIYEGLDKIKDARDHFFQTHTCMTLNITKAEALRLFGLYNTTLTLAAFNNKVYLSEGKKDR